ncbi:MAG TPA: hypothetical protein DCZ94_22210 [Lentisphaeria bacterium]|nr:MAG: hypothetical protein A2X48_13450 [Lentisphaerae bacterium GWF2_49_21]HBC89662.1 hypothetical protein [Lentisphaeria bacterium]
MKEYHIIDCHWHPAIDARTDTGWFGPVGSIRKQIETLRRAGISQACGAPIEKIEKPASFRKIRLLNDKAFALRDKHPDFYIPGIHIHPKFPDESCCEIERCCGGEGVRWIGELVGRWMDYGDDFATKNALQIFRTAIEYDAVVNFHCGDLKVIGKLCATLPELKLVLAHPSSNRMEFLERIKIVSKFKNLHLDISGAGIDRFGILRKAIDMAGTDKILFGTDYPINNPAVYTHGAKLEDLSEKERKLLFGGNFLRLTK